MAAHRRLGYSHRRLGKALGLDPSRIYKWECGQVPRNVRSWQRLEPMFVSVGHRSSDSSAALAEAIPGQGERSFRPLTENQGVGGSNPPLGTM